MVDKVGRPTDYTKELGDIICARLADGESLRNICIDEGMPHRATIFRWLLSENELYSGFRDQYATARKIQAETLADDIFDIADDGTNDWIEKFDKEGGSVGYQLNGEHVQRSRLRVDTRKWFLSKVIPKFADKQQPNETPTNMAEVLAKLIDRLPS